MNTPARCTRTWPAVSVCAAYDTGTHRCAALDSYHHVQHVCECGNVDVAARCTRTDPHMRHNVYDDAGMWLEVCPGVEPPADCCSHTWRTVGYCSGNDGGAHHCSALDSYHHVQHICVCGNVEPPAKPWDEVPEQNRALMIATCAEVGAHIRAQAFAEAYGVLKELDLNDLEYAHFRKRLGMTDDQVFDR